MTDDNVSSSFAGSLIEHLTELRSRLIKMVACVLFIFCCLFFFADRIYNLLALPLLNALPQDASMIAVDIASPVLVPYKLVMLLSVFLAIPFLFYQIWAFIAPGLYRREKRLALPLLISSTLLFYLGVAFAYFIIFRVVFTFIISFAPDGVTIMTDISRYLDFVITMFLAFGLAFEVPVAIVLLVIAGFTTPDSLAEKRPYIIVAAFVIGMFLTPPDVVSQLLLAFPIWILFEVGIIFARIVYKRQLQQVIAED